MDDRHRATRSQSEATARVLRAATPGRVDTSPPAGGDVLLTDAERDAAASVVRRALSEGSLTVEEAEGRLETTFAARRRSELDGLLADLPQRSSWREGRAAHVHRARHAPRSALFAALGLIALLIIIASAVTGQRPWPLAPLAFFAMRALWWQRGWRGPQASSSLRWVFRNGS